MHRLDGPLHIESIQTGPYTLRYDCYFNPDRYTLRSKVPNDSFELYNAMHHSKENPLPDNASDILLSRRSLKRRYSSSVS